MKSSFDLTSAERGSNRMMRKLERQSNDTPSEFGNFLKDSRPLVDEASFKRQINLLKLKLSDLGVKYTSLYRLCEMRDRTSEGTIHIDDFDEILDDILSIKKDYLTRRDRKLILSACGFDKHSNRLIYSNLDRIFHENWNREEKDDIEKWKDSQNNDLDECELGSIGEWMKEAACPAEIQNYRTLISHLENFERESGLRIKVNADKIVVPLGPDLKAELKFTVK